ncbi:hypothetical protein [Sphingomonas sp.]|jgi:hypothetical protein|uniref:hypothetical protein n=1 Tax=Sphingomonas sp. TaxID=28214 RepID=UPI0039C9B1D9
MSAMFGAKPLASLSSQLLARKGQAKPAMRSQGYGGFAASAATAGDDLGWNDMGHGVGAAEPPAPGPVLVTPVPPSENAAPVPVPPVVTMREALSEKVQAQSDGAASEPVAPSTGPIEPRPVSLATAARIGRDSAKQTKGGKAAFTLRLDARRHLRLRLASALANRSAQAIVADALDRLLDTMPQVDTLIAQLPEPKSRRG